MMRVEEVVVIDGRGNVKKMKQERKSVTTNPEMKIVRVGRNDED